VSQLFIQNSLARTGLEVELKVGLCLLLKMNNVGFAGLELKRE
jgi:hypothetical protein